MKKKISLLVLALVSASACLAQSNAIRELKQEQYPVGFDNHTFGVFYYNGKTVYANRGIDLFSGDTIKDVRINPAYSSLTSLEKTKKGQIYAAIYGISEKDALIQKIKLKNNSWTALAYSQDAKQLALANDNKQIIIYDPVGKTIAKTLTSQIVPQKMLFSGNNFFMVAAQGKTLEVWNAERGTIRKTLNFGSPINDFSFGENNSKMLVVTADGKLTVYETATFEPKTTVDDLDKALAVQANNDGKYAIVLCNDKRICAVNLLDPTERIFLENSTGGTSDIRFVYNYLEDASTLFIIRTTRWYIAVWMV